MTFEASENEHESLKLKLAFDDGQPSSKNSADKAGFNFKLMYETILSVLDE